HILNTDLANAFPTLYVYALIGNNDSYRGDYYLETNGLFFNDSSDLWSKLIKNKKNQMLFKQQFTRNAYYAIEIPNQPKLNLIVLNSVLFSTYARGRRLNEAADEQLNWLHRQLQSIKNKQ